MCSHCTVCERETETEEEVLEQNEQCCCCTVHGRNGVLAMSYRSSYYSVYKSNEKQAEISWELC